MVGQFVAVGERIGFAGGGDIGLAGGDGRGRYWWCWSG